MRVQFVTRTVVVAKRVSTLAGRQRPALERTGAPRGEVRKGFRADSITPNGRGTNTTLDCSVLPYAEPVIDALIDDWIVPALVERFLSERRHLGEGPVCGDNRCP